MTVTSTFCVYGKPVWSPFVRAVVTTLDVIGDLVTGTSSVAEEKIHCIREFLHDSDRLTFDKEYSYKVACLIKYRLGLCTTTISGPPCWPFAEVHVSFYLLPWRRNHTEPTCKLRQWNINQPVLLHKHSVELPWVLYVPQSPLCISVIGGGEVEDPEQGRRGNESF